jgi:hypothetical protein
MTRFLRIIALMLAVLLFLVPVVPVVDGAVHGHRHHRRDDKGKAASTILPLSLETAAVTPAVTPAATLAATPVGDAALFEGPATPCSGVFQGCATAVPDSALMCPRRNQTAWTESSTAQKYTITCDVDFPAQNIYPFVLAGSFEECMKQCESFNAKNSAGRVRCEGFVFAPERILFSDDCYLKSSLNHPSSATIYLIGATKLPSLSLAAIPNAKPATTSTYHPPKTLTLSLIWKHQALLQQMKSLHHQAHQAPSSLLKLHDPRFMAHPSTTRPLNGSIMNLQLP